MKKTLMLLVFSIFAGLFVVVPLPHVEENSGVALCTNDFIKGSLLGKPLAGNELSLLSWNVYKEQENSWEKDFAQLSLGVDILALQESAVKSGRNKVLDTLGYTYVQTKGFRVNTTSFGVVIGLGRDMAELATRSCGLRAVEPIVRIPKTALLTRIATASGELMVVSIHSVNFSLGLDAYRKQLSALSQLLAEYTHPIIVAGDFNTWSDGRQQLVDAFALQHGLQSVNYTEDNRSMVFSHVLDHVYVRGLRNVQTTVYQVDSSDHSPIRVDFSLM